MGRFVSIMRSEFDDLAKRSGQVKVGVPTEVKVEEYRVAMTPAGVRELIETGHEVFIQAGAGLGSAIADGAYSRSNRKGCAD